MKYIALACMKEMDNETIKGSQWVIECSDNLKKMDVKFMKGYGPELELIPASDVQKKAIQTMIASIVKESDIDLTKLFTTDTNMKFLFINSLTTDDYEPLVFSTVQDCSILLNPIYTLTSGIHKMVESSLRELVAQSNKTQNIKEI